MVKFVTQLHYLQNFVESTFNALPSNQVKGRIVLEEVCEGPMGQGLQKYKACLLRLY
ncbi:hypothetical protein C1H46_045625 [Malus baccata]|uniref:Uncharacterized protein n=1 Tax=Malus baccata TaxID=106549 RepID=A0A540K4P6_MALBA|nr:hypothetical protein C1H46_045625 [Malus baccata]